MHNSKNVVVFTLVTTFILFSYSFLAAVTNTNVLGLNNVSILSDVLYNNKEDKQPEIPAAKDTAAIATAVVDSALIAKPEGARSINTYTLRKTLTNFSTDTSKPALPMLMKKLHALKQGKKTKVRIAWFGDSMIEGDLLSLTFRKKMQQYFGNYGVGFIPANSVTAGFRTTAVHKWKGEWKEENFKTKELSVPLFLSGHTYYTNDGELNIRDVSFKDTAQPLEKSLLCGAVAGGVVNIVVNGHTKQYHADKALNRLMLDSGNSHNINVGIQDNKLPVYGISIEPESGVVVDNFSFRGITGLELGKLDTSFLHLLDEENPYDLVILEYGANLMYRPEDMDYSWYRKHIIPVVQRLQRAMPHTEFLIVSASDRAFRYDDKWKTAVGMNNLIKIQAELAYNNGAAFYNMYASMGGAGTIVNWADSMPALANKDYIHPNFRGAEVLGTMLYDAFMKDYNKVKRKQK